MDCVTFNMWLGPVCFRGMSRLLKVFWEGFPGILVGICGAYFRWNHCERKIVHLFDFCIWLVITTISNTVQIWGTQPTNYLIQHMYTIISYNKWKVFVWVLSIIETSWGWAVSSSGQPRLASQQTKRNIQTFLLLRRLQFRKFAVFFHWITWACLPLRKLVTIFNFEN